MKYVVTVFLLVLSSFVPAAEPLQILTTHYPPYQYSENGQVQGFSAEAVRAIAKEAGLEVRIRTYTWPRASEYLQRLPNQLFFNLSRTPEREKQFHWVANITPNQIYLWRQRERRDIRPESVENLLGYNFAVLPSSVSHRFLQQQGISDSHFTTVIDNMQKVRMLFRGRVDLVAMDELSFIDEVRNQQLPLEAFERVMLLPQISGHSYLAANRTVSIETVRRLQAAWQRIQADGTYQRILNRYLLPDTLALLESRQGSQPH